MSTVGTLTDPSWGQEGSLWGTLIFMELALELFYDPAECPGKEAPVSLSEWRQEVLLCFLGQTEWPSSFKITLGITEVCPRAGGA